MSGKGGPGGGGKAQPRMSGEGGRLDRVTRVGAFTRDNQTRKGFKKVRNQVKESTEEGKR